MPRVQNPFITLMVSDVQLTAAQVQNLHTTPVQIIPAPGAGLTVVGVELAVALGVGTVPFATQGTDNLTFPYTGTSGLAPFGAQSALVARTVNSIKSAAASALNNATFGVASGVDNQAVNVTAASLYNAGPIAAATIGAPGSGYAVNDTGNINAGLADAAYIITSIGAGGAVTGFTITAPGTRYIVANGVATVDGGAQPGVGAGFTVNITAVNLGNGTLRVAAYYVIVPTP